MPPYKLLGPEGVKNNPNELYSHQSLRFSILLLKIPPALAEGQKEINLKPPPCW